MQAMEQPTRTITIWTGAQAATRAMPLYELIRQPEILLAIIRGANVAILGLLARICRISAQIIQQNADTITIGVRGMAQELRLLKWRVLHGVGNARPYPFIHQWVNKHIDANDNYTSVTVSMGSIYPPRIWRYWKDGYKIACDFKEALPRDDIIWTPKTHGTAQFDSLNIHQFMRGDEYVIWGGCPCGRSCHPLRLASE